MQNIKSKHKIKVSIYQIVQRGNFLKSQMIKETFTNHMNKGYVTSLLNFIAYLLL